MQMKGFFFAQPDIVYEIPEFEVVDKDPYDVDDFFFHAIIGVKC